MKTHAYLRFSTDKQDERQQLNTITKYVESKGMHIDDVYSDEGVHGDTSYTKRNLFDLCKSLQKNDIVIVSEISRITRSGISELSEIIKKHFAPNHLRLIICNVGLDVDCSDINPMTEMQLSMLATFARIEKCLIQERTKSSLETRKKLLADNGSFVSKSGRVCTKLGRPKGHAVSDNTVNACIAAHKTKAKNNQHNAQFYKYLNMFEQREGFIKDNATISRFVQELATLDYRTARGLKFDIPRAWAMIYKVRKLYDKEIV